MKYRKKPVVIEAVQWTGFNVEEVLPFFGDISKLPNNGVYVNPGIGHCLPAGELYIPTLEGEMTARAGDWIIKGVKGEYYPCKPDIFAATYEPAEQNAAAVQTVNRTLSDQPVPVSATAAAPIAQSKSQYKRLVTQGAAPDPEQRSIISVAESQALELSESSDAGVAPRQSSAVPDTAAAIDQEALRLEGMEEAGKLFNGLSYGPYEHPTETIQAEIRRREGK